MSGFIDECKKMHIRVKGPDVNESFANFGVNSKGDIRFGLAAIKGVGENVVNDIINARKKVDRLSQSMTLWKGCPTHRSTAG